MKANNPEYQEKAPRATETFGQFMDRVDAFLASKLGGMESDDLVDCAWNDLYHDCYDQTGEDFRANVIDTVTDYNPETYELLQDGEDE